MRHQRAQIYNRTKGMACDDQGSDFRIHGCKIGRHGLFSVCAKGRKNEAVQSFWRGL